MFLPTQSATPVTTGPHGRIPDALHLSLSLPAHPRRVQPLRLTVGALLRQRDIGEDAVETVQLLVSELVTNAVVHGRTDRVGFSLTCDPGGDVLIEVDDRSAARVEVVHPGPESESGRGMFLVAALARAWGRRGTCTWCAVATSTASGAP